MILNIFTIFFLFLFTLIVKEKITNNFLKNFFIIFFTAFIILQINSIFYIGNLIDYQFINYFKVIYFFEFINQTKFLSFISFLFFLILFYFIKNFNLSKFFFFNKSKIFILLISFAIFALPKKGLVRNFFDFFYSSQINNSILEKNKLITQNNKNIKFEEMITELNIKDYVNKNDLVSQKGKNIIFLTVESLDSSFLEKFNLSYIKKLKVDNKYLEFKDSKHIKDSISYLYSLLHGAPLITQNLKINFNNLILDKMTTLGDVLNKAGYNSSFFIGDASFTGIRTLLNLSHFKVKDMSNFDDVEKFSWGIHDSDLFKKVKDQIIINKKENYNFSIFVNTFNTHLEGISDPNYECGFFEKKIKCASKNVEVQIKNLILFLKKNNLFSNTVIFIANDHKSMSFKNKNSKNYVLIINGQKNLDYKHDQITQMSLPRLITDQSGIKTNAKFLSDYKNINYDDNVVKKIIESSMFFEDDLNGLQIKLKNNYLSISAASYQRLITKNFIEPSKKKIFLSLIVDDKYRINNFYSSNKIIKYKNPAKLNIDQIIIEVNDGKIINAYQQNLINYKIKKFMIIKNAFLYRRDQKNLDLYKKTNHFIAHAGGQFKDILYSNSLEAMNLSYKLGFKKIELDLRFTSDGKLVAVHDWETWKDRTGYSFDIPPNYKNFMSHNQFGNLTPVDLNMINSWFKKNKDAFLVTDKIDDVEYMLKNFIDKKRLFMEIFSIDSINVAQKYKFNNFLINYSLLKKFYFKKDKISFLNKYKIKNVALPATVLEESNKFFLKRIKNKILNNYYFHEINNLNLNLYFFHINYRKSRQEKNFYCNFMKNNHFVYFDYWNFKNPSCNFN